VYVLSFFTAFNKVRTSAAWAEAWRALRHKLQAYDAYQSFQRRFLCLMRKLVCSLIGVAACELQWRRRG